MTKMDSWGAMHMPKRANGWRHTETKEQLRIAEERMQARINADHGRQLEAVRRELYGI